MAGSRLVYDFTHNASARFRYALGRVSGSSRDGARSTHSPRLTPLHAHLQAAVLGEGRGLVVWLFRPYLAVPDGDALGHLGHKGRRSLAAHGPRLTPPLLPLQVTPIHWGWEVVHDGWEFRSQAERGLCTQHISKKSLVVRGGGANCGGEEHAGFWLLTSLLTSPRPSRSSRCCRCTPCIRAPIGSWCAKR